MLGLLLLLCAAITIWLVIWLAPYLSQEAAWLDLNVEGPLMAKIGDTFTATISPTNAAGGPAPVFNVAYVTDGAYSVSPAPDGMSAFITAVAAGEGSLDVSATTKGGATLFASFDLPAVESPVDEEAVALNLAVA